MTEWMSLYEWEIAIMSPKDSFLKHLLHWIYTDTGCINPLYSVYLDIEKGQYNLVTVP